MNLNLSHQFLSQRLTLDPRQPNFGPLLVRYAWRWNADQQIRDIARFVQHAREVESLPSHGHLGGGFSWPWYVSGIDTRKVVVS